MPTATTPYAPHTSITHPLARLRGMIRLFVAVDVALFVCLFVTLWFWLGVGFDFGLFKFTGFDLAQSEPSGYLRGTLLVLFIVLAIALVSWRVWGLLTKEFSYPALALLLEKRHPDLLGDRLITAVELADVKAAAQYGYSAEMIEDTIKQARERVGQVPLRGIFNYRRLVMKTLVIGLLVLLGVTTAFAIHSVSNKTAEPTKFGWQFSDVASIWGERNLLLMNTPWPRRAYVEIIEFPEPAEVLAAKGRPASDEKRIEKGAKPTVKARVYKWVHVNPGSYDGWRPLRYADLTEKVLGFAPPACPVPGNPTCDELELAYQQAALTDVYAKLNQIAEDPWYSRKIRRLDTSMLTASQTPAEGAAPTSPVQLDYRGVNTGKPGSIALTRAPSGEYFGEICEVVNGNVVSLTDSVSFSIALEDFRTSPKTITLVPAPAMNLLERTEYQPAYLFYPAPTDGTIADLAGKLQKLAPKRLSLTGDKTVFTVPVGTGVEFSATVDKPLTLVTLTNKTLGALLYTKTADAPFENFHIELTGVNAIRAKTEYLLTMTDTDEVSSTRVIDISVGDDKPPDVEVGPDIVRKIGNEYWITPKAKVPFDVNSFIKDDNGLSDVRYSFTWRKVESQIIDQGKSLLAAGLANAFGSPIRSWGFPLTIAGHNKVYSTFQSATPVDVKTGSLPVGGFESLYSAQSFISKKQLAEKLLQPITEGDSGAVRQFTYKNQNSDVFDLLANGMPTLLVKDPNDAQPRYQIELFLEATDINADFRSPTGNYGKTTRGIAPIRLLVVSEEDLIAKISEDEEKLGTAAKDALNRAEDGRTKMLPEVSLMKIDVVSPKQFESTYIRFLDIGQDIGRAKEHCKDIQKDVERVLKEFEFNRCNPSIQDKWQINYLNKVIAVLKDQFPAAESALLSYQSQLAAKQKPTELDNLAVTEAIAALIDALAKLKSGFIDNNTLAREIARLNNILKSQREIQEAIEKQRQVTEEILRQPNIALTKQYTIKAGQKTTLTLPVVWGFYVPPKGELTIRVEIAEGTPVQGPATIIAKDDRDDYKLELTAGDKVGVYTITLTPLIGKPTQLRVEVQK